MPTSNKSPHLHRGRNVKLLRTVSNKKKIFRVLDLVELYDFDINFIIIQVYLKKI